VEQVLGVPEVVYPEEHRRLVLKEALGVETMGRQLEPLQVARPALVLPFKIILDMAVVAAAAVV
jgi:hypothetical protein